MRAWPPLRSAGCVIGPHQRDIPQSRQPVQVSGQGSAQLGFLRRRSGQGPAHGTIHARRWTTTRASISAQYCSTAPLTAHQSRTAKTTLATATPTASRTGRAGSQTRAATVHSRFWIRPATRQTMLPAPPGPTRQGLLDQGPAGRQIQPMTTADPLLEGREGIASAGRPRRHRRLDTRPAWRLRCRDVPGSWRRDARRRRCWLVNRRASQPRVPRGQLNPAITLSAGPVSIATRDVPAMTTATPSSATATNRTSA